MALKTRSFPLAYVDAFSYRSDLMGDDYDITVGLPHDYQEHPDRHYAALVVLDGNLHFSSINLLARSLVLDVDDIIVVGVDIPIEITGIRHERKRVHQFSPACDWPMTDLFGEKLKEYLEDSSDEAGSVQDYIGGADNFLAFIGKELLPELQRQYRIDPHDIGLAGNSAAGFFASCVLFAEQNRFTKFLISSPAMAYGDGEIFRLEEHWAKHHADLNASVYMGAGALEINTVYYEGRGQIVSGMSKLAGILTMRNYPGLNLCSDIYPGVGHIDSLFPTVARGLRRFYGKHLRQ